MSQDRFTILFHCPATGARAAMAEAILRERGAAHLRAASTGAAAVEARDPVAMALLRRLGYDEGTLAYAPLEALRAWRRPVADLVVTFGRGEHGMGALSIFAPVVVSWAIPDPAEAGGSPAQVGLAYAEAYRMLRRRIACLSSLPAADLGPVLGYRGLVAPAERADFIEAA